MIVWEKYSNEHWNAEQDFPLGGEAATLMLQSLFCALLTAWLLDVKKSWMKGGV